MPRSIAIITALWAELSGVMTRLFRSFIVIASLMQTFTHNPHPRQISSFMRSFFSSVCASRRHSPTPSPPQDIHRCTLHNRCTVHPGQREDNSRRLVRAKKCKTFCSEHRLAAASATIADKVHFFPHILAELNEVPVVCTMEKIFTFR